MAESDTIQVFVPQRHQNRPVTRQLTVDEALQFTPLTTSVLPAHDRIPIPQLSHSYNFRLTSHAERQSVYRTEFCNPKVRERLAVLLDPSRLSEMYDQSRSQSYRPYLIRNSKFKRSPVRGESKAKLDLNPMQKMVLQKTKIDYAYPSFTPIKIDDAYPSVKSYQKRPTPKSNLDKVFSSTPLNPNLAVEIPQMPPAFRREEYAALPKSPKRRKLNESNMNGNVALTVSSKKEKDDFLLTSFENQLLEIFEAQDRLAPDTSTTATNHDRTVFDFLDEDDDSEPRLSVASHEKLQATLSHLVTSARLIDASPEYLRRLQVLCEPAIEAAQTVNLRTQPDQTEEDIKVWLNRLHKAESGAASACTFIYIALGNPQKEELVNLEVLQWLPNILVNVFENCLIPIVESRVEGQDSHLFQLAYRNSDAVKRLLDSGRKLLDLVARVCIQIKGAGSIVNSTDFMASKLIFVQNAYNDKTSAIGSQTYERVRKQAMAALAKLYAAFPSERNAILDEILTSLDKLPSNSRSARQYKLGNGKSIQLVSALFMQLVQTPAMSISKKQSLKKSRYQSKRTDGSDSSDNDSASDSEADEDLMTNNHDDPLSKLGSLAESLFDDAFRSAQHIVGWMVDKASKVTKTGDSPYRNILDLFVEDLTIVLPSTDWPASELLLTVLAVRMISLAKNDRAASTKNMALESLGVMGSAISVTRASARSSLASIIHTGESGPSLIARDLSDLVKDRAHFLLQNDELILNNGPYSIIRSYLSSKGGESLRTRSARAYFLVQYAAMVARTLKGCTKQGDEGKQVLTLDTTVDSLLQQLSEPDEPGAAYKDDRAVTSQEAQLAYMLCILNMRFCRRFPEIAKTLASSLSSDQAQVRSRSLKSVVTILETDSSLLDWDPTIADDVFKCASDDSSLVRDSALSLIAKFIVPRPALEQKAFKRLLACAGDGNVGVQKRAIGHLKDIYLKESRINVRTTIATEFLRRTSDLEASVAELASKTLTDIWIVPKLALLASSSESAHAEVAIDDLKAHIVSCVNQDTIGLGPMLKNFLVWKLKNSKHADQVRHLYARIVKNLLDMANASEAGPADLTTLVAFAEARPQTIVPGDLASLKSYLKDLSQSDDLLKFRSVVTIFRCVLPHLSSTQSQLLLDVQLDLMKAGPKVVRREDLEEVMSCLRSIDGVLHNTAKLVAFAISILQHVLRPQLPAQVREKLLKENPKEVTIRENATRAKMLRLIGTITKYIDFEQHPSEFRQKFPSFKSGSVAGFIADSVVPYTFKDVPIEVRSKALESLGSICQAWPGQFIKKHIRETFFQILDGALLKSVSENDIMKMQLVVLGTFQELYATRAGAKAETDKGEGQSEVQALKNIGGTSKAREDDSAISTITNPLVDHLLRIAMSEKGEKAFLAAQTLASVDHQGMTHPKQSTAAFVALETSPESRVASVARIAHEYLHQQHESVCEREYIHAVYEAFRYQNEVFQDPQGATVPGFKAKLSAAFTIISTSGSKYVKKFLSSLVSKLNTEYSKLNVENMEVPSHLLFVLFVTQNMAFFEYKKMDELLHTVLQLELAFGKNGGELAQVIEALVPPEAKPTEVNGELDAVIQPSEHKPEPQVDPALLRQLCVAACAITLVSEARNFLKRQYGISRDVKVAMQQNKHTKEATKEPVKVHGITGDRFWTNSNAVLASLESTETMMARCKEFVMLVAIDDEVKIAEDESEAYVVENGFDASLSAPRGKKRKSTGSIGGTPKRPRGKPPKNGRRSSSISSMEDPDADFAG
ncbi:uncharacterized protein A1O9_11030 [Exophiala aquamarina CBS 119918]|uniref:Sister chromatid cohesion protein n=1 Tax=Exophiala aquamarina CBS 119918 TaxID=1182545 RepID=A0A072P0B4_9EURO|nr:uncharacterized protein A1O9_11030 [Exophiala aquamarina CBS 119918]KEF53122.1 hypothetical protein A1O9_11030 [Exophiala aquamarina CBS 119918]